MNVCMLHSGTYRHNALVTLIKGSTTWHSTTTILVKCTQMCIHYATNLRSHCVMSAFAVNPLSHSTGSVFCWMVIMYNWNPTSVLQITHTYLPQALQTCWDGCIHRQLCLGFYSCWCIHHWPSLPFHLKDQEQVANMHHSSIIINIRKKSKSRSYQCIVLCLNMRCLCWHFPLQKPYVILIFLFR